MTQNIADVLAAFVDEFGEEPVVTGGGKGWSARFHGGFSAKGTSKVAAIEALTEVLRAEEESHAEEDEAEVTLDGPQDGEEMECSEECQSSQSDYCQCKCDGAMHGIAYGRRESTVAIGEKPCKCGCGETTKRLYVPGHDARHHAELALRKWAAEQGLPVQTAEDLEAARKAKKAAVRKVARDRRATQRAEVKAKAEEVAKSIVAKQPKRRKATSPAGTKGLSDLLSLTDSPKGDDLPF